MSISNSSMLNFSYNDISLIGSSGIWDAITGLDVLNYQYEGAAPSKTIDGVSYIFDVTTFDIGLIFEPYISGGVFDLNYNVEHTVELPDMIQIGDSYIIDTTMGNIYNPSVVIQGPSFDLSASLGYNLELTAKMWGEFLGMDFSTGGTLSASKSIEVFGTELEKDIELIKDVLSLNFNIDSTGLNAEETLEWNSNQIANVEVTATPDNPYVSLNLDIDDLIGQFYKPASTLDMSYENSSGSVSFDAGILSLDAFIGASPYIKASTNITGIGVDMVSSTGESQSGVLGD